MIKGMWSAYCDGSGTYHADSPACIGVVVADETGRIVVECSAYVGPGTNNVAELWAVRRALYLLRWCGPQGEFTPAVIFSDSEYALSMTRGEYAPKKNVDLVWELSKQYDRHRGFAHLQHVRGHAGNPGNELADWLAGLARARVLRERGKDYKFRGRPKGVDTHVPALLRKAVG